MAEDFTVTLAGTDPRAAEWQAVYGTLTVAVKSPVPCRVELPERGPSLVYLLDVPLLSAEQHARLVLHLAAKFGAPPEEVAEYLATTGVLPLLADGCIVTVAHPQKWF